jgi:hypothetical protein
METKCEQARIFKLVPNHGFFTNRITWIRPYSQLTPGQLETRDAILMPFRQNRRNEWLRAPHQTTWALQ